MKKPLGTIAMLAALFSAACQQKPQTSQTEQPSTTATTTQAPAPEAAPAPATPPTTANATPPAPAKSAILKPVPAPVLREAEIPAGTPLSVRIDQALSTADNQPNDTFSASLVSPVIVEGKEILPEGTRFKGHVTEAEASGRLKGTGILSVKLDSFELKGRSYDLPSSVHSITTKGHGKRNVGIIAGGAGLGALVGALAGHGKGAAIGAAAGAGAGTATAAATGKQQADLPAESVVEFTTKSAVTVRQ